MKVSATLVSLLVLGALVLGKAWITQRNERRFEEQQEEIQKRWSEEARRISSKFDAMQKELEEKSKSGKALTNEDYNRLKSEGEEIEKELIGEADKEHREQGQVYDVPATRPSATATTATAPNP